MSRIRTSKASKFVKKRRSFKKRGGPTKRRKKSSVYSTLSRPRGSPYPENKLVIHRYVSRVTVPAAGFAGNTRGWVFRANSLFDPDFTGFGHQPLYHDQMTPNYEKYQVIASTIRVIIPNEQSTAQLWSAWMDDEDDFDSDPYQVAENKRIKSYVTKLDKKNNTLIFSMKYNIQKDNHGASLKSLIGEPERVTDAGANPAGAIARYFKFCSWPIDSTVVLAEMKIAVEMTFTTIWSEPVAITTS